MVWVIGNYGVLLASWSWRPPLWSRSPTLTLSRHHGAVFAVGLLFLLFGTTNTVIASRSSSRKERASCLHVQINVSGLSCLSVKSLLWSHPLPTFVRGVQPLWLAAQALPLVLKVKYWTFRSHSGLDLPYLEYFKKTFHKLRLCDMWYHPVRTTIHRRRLKLHNRSLFKIRPFEVNTVPNFKDESVCYESHESLEAQARFDSCAIWHIRQD